MDLHVIISADWGWIILFRDPVVIRAVTRHPVAAGLLCVLAATVVLAPAYADVLPPLKQLAAGVPPGEIRCNGDRILVIRDNGSPACVFPGSVDRLGQSATPALRASPGDGMFPPSLASNPVQGLPPNTVTPTVAQYSLPLEADRIQNWSEFTQEIPLGPADVELLERNGFVVIPGDRDEYMHRVYETLEERVPVYVTPDSVLHLYHVQFAESLKGIETEYFFDDLWQLSASLVDASLAQHGSLEDPLLREAALRNAAYFAVGLRLLEPGADQLASYHKPDDRLFTREESKRYSADPPDLAGAGETVGRELNLIGDAAGRSKSPLFGYALDYSLFAPRGHYTQSEKLKNYFQAMVWYGTPTFPILHENERTERLMAAQSVLMSDALLADDRLRERWDRIYAVTSFYVGESDDLGPYEYRAAYGAATGADAYDLNLLADPAVHDALRIELAKLPAPRIYGGIGHCEITLPWTAEKAEGCLENSKGFRLMGQRFIPDSYVFSNLVGMEYAGTGEPFTVVSTELGPIRGFPSSLDIMHVVLGSERALGILREQGDARYEGYDLVSSELRAEFASLDTAHWSQNLYWGWLHSLQALLGPYQEGYPTFMGTAAWQDKSISTAAASWSELRHDTILYAKQSSGGGITSAPPPPPPVTGYVEPAPEFYSRMHQLAVQTRDGLDGFGLLDEGARANHDSMISTFERLHDISLRELANEYLTEEDYDFIDNFSDAMLKPLRGMDLKNTRTTLVADVHTEPNTGQVLEVATGYVDLMIVAYALPEGQIVLGAGPVFSYYEFKHLMGERLTDEAWRQMLASDGAPPRPAWTAGFVGR